MIDGVVITPLKRIEDDRGSVMHMLRCDSKVFDAFGEFYFSTVHTGVIKAWHYHKRMTINYAVPMGQIKFVLFDDREDSPTKGNIQEIDLGENNYALVTVPPKIWYGFLGTSRETALIANCTTLPHNPEEVVRREPDNVGIQYDWQKDCL